MACLHVSNAVWCLSHLEIPKLVLKSELTEDKLHFFSVSYLQLMKQRINICKALYCVKWVQEVDTVSLDLEKGKDLLAVWVIQPIAINSKFNYQHPLQQKKLKTLSETETSCVIVHGCNFIMHSDIFIPLVTMIGRCPECVAAVNIEPIIAQKMGLSQFFAISCTKCDCVSIFVHQKRLLSQMIHSVGNHLRQTGELWLHSEKMAWELIL